MDHHEPSPSEPLQNARIDAAELGFTDSLEVYRDLLGVFNDVHFEAPRPGGISFLATTWTLDSLLFSHTRGPARTLSRNARHRARSPWGFVQLRLYLRGHAHKRIAGQDVKVDPGAVHLVNFDHDFEQRGTEGDQFTAFIPHHVIGYDANRHPPHLRFDPTSASGRILSAATLAMQQELPSLCQADAPMLANGFAGLVRGLLGNGWDSQDDASVQGARAATMRQYLDQHLSDPNVGPATLAKAFGASRATIYRDFAEHGGVERYIVRRRLDRAYHELTRQPPRRGAVTAVAEAWGFASIHHFSRLFRAEFGMSPSDAVGLWQEPAASEVDGAEPIARPHGSQYDHAVRRWLSHP